MYGHVLDKKINVQRVPTSPRNELLMYLIIFIIIPGTQKYKDIIRKTAPLSRIKTYA